MEGKEGAVAGSVAVGKDEREQQRVQAAMACCNRWPGSATSVG